MAVDLLGRRPKICPQNAVLNELVHRKSHLDAERIRANLDILNCSRLSSDIVNTSWYSAFGWLRKYHSDTCCHQIWTLATVFQVFMYATCLYCSNQSCRFSNVQRVAVRVLGSTRSQTWVSDIDVDEFDEFELDIVVWKCPRISFL